MRHRAALTICLLLILALPGPLDAADVATIVVRDHPAAPPWPRLGVLAYGTPFMATVDRAMDKAEAWGIGSLRLQPKAKDNLTSLNKQLLRNTECRPWLTLPARDLDKNPEQVVQWARDLLASLDPEVQPMWIEPINEGWTRTGFNYSDAAWLDFHERVLVKLQEAGVSIPLMGSALLTDNQGASIYRPAIEFGRAQRVVDVHHYIGVRGSDLDLDGDAEVHKKFNVSPTRIQGIQGAWNAVPRSIRSVNSLTASKWKVSIYCSKHEAADNPEGTVKFYVGDTLIYTLVGAQHTYGKTVTETVSVQASGKCTVRTQGGQWKNVTVHTRGKPFLWLDGSDWLINAMARFAPAPAVLGWLDGSWSQERWGQTWPMNAVIGEAGVPWWGRDQTGQYSLPAVMMFLRQYQVYAQHRGILAVHWHSSVPDHQTPFGVAMEWFAKVRKGRMRRVDVQGDNLYALASDTGVLFLNPCGDRTVLIKGVTPASGTVKRLAPAARRRHRADISATLTMRHVRVDKARVTIRHDGIVQIPLAPGIALLETAR